MELNHHPPRKVDRICSLARRLAKAKGAALVLYEGETGSGMSVQCDRRLIKHLPVLLRELADGVEREAKHQAPES